ncbi:MAG: tRNA (adenosine(37)-N6)-dimethylallyltransferase MiaA [Acidobacteriota bacterium]|nr:tRNA (adenosine(37)-N6)-dimethylallyltransferase MiaA [Acidobacteriota bacterium]
MDHPLHKEAPLIAIVGPTGSGKSALALQIARRFTGEIVNCDSVQIYRHFDIGSAKTPPGERYGVPHHVIDVAEPSDVFTAGEYSRIARLVLHDIAARDRLAVVTGGTGFYLRALIDGLAPGPERNEMLRERLLAREQRRPGSLHVLLRRFDRLTALRIHANDIPKVMRAVEICLTSRLPAAEVFAGGRDPLTGFRVLKIGLFPNREQLYQRLEARLNAMFEYGIVEETRSILAAGWPESSKPFESIGYKQALQLVKGELTLKEALYYARRDTRHYAKRQMTWFRQEKGLEIFPGFGEEIATAAAVEARVERFLG